MPDDRPRIMMNPFEAGLLAPPAAADAVLVLNARPGPALLPAAASVEHVQDYRPDYLALKAAGARVEPTATGNRYDHAFVVCGRHRRQNEAWLAEALMRTRRDGLILVAGTKKDGIASFRKAVSDRIPLGGQAAKHHGAAFWLRCPADAAQLARDLSPPAGAQLAEGFVTGPGMFSADHVDPASRLLARHLPAGATGLAADFGAGWGYLSVELAARAPGLQRIDLHEASHSACEAARRNMSALAPAMPATITWHDLLSEEVQRLYDLVVMNPPFHRGRASEPSMGEGMIAAAGKALKPGGRLLMVANRQLPYEGAIAAAFARQRQLALEDGFKVIEARR